MASNIQSVSFASPQAIIAPDLAAQQQQYARRVQLANALRGQALQDTNAGRGSVSWTQGLARLADALLANREFKKSDQMLGGMSRAYAQALGAQFGVPQSQPEPQQAPAQPMPQDTGPLAGVMNDVRSSPEMAAETQSQQPVANPPADAAPAPVAPSPGPMPSTPGALALTGDPRSDMTMYAMDPDAYMKGVISAHSPVDMAKTVQQARAAFLRGDYATASALMQNIQKQNYVAPVNVRQGSTVLDPNTHMPIFENPRVPEGASVQFGPDGRPTGISPIPGAAGAIATASGAQAAGKAAYSPMQTFDPNTGAPVYQTQAQVAQAAAGGNPMMAGPPIGMQAAADVTGKNSANAFNGVAESASDAPNRIYGLHQMAGIIDNGLRTGAGSGTMTQIAGRWNTVAPDFAQINPQQIANRQELDKWSAQVSSRYASELGLSGSDHRTDLAIHATPNGEMTPQALKAIIPQMVGFENAKMGRAQAANVWQQTHGPQTFQQFSATWNQNYDPRIYTWLADGSVAQNMAALKKSSPAEYNALVHKATVLGQIGAIPQ